MHIIDPIEPDGAGPAIQRIFQAGEKQYGVLFNNWKVVAHAATTLRPYTQFIGAFLNPDHLDKRYLELGIMMTTLLNQCRYCLTHHYHQAIKAGITDQEILAILEYQNYAGFSAKDKAALGLARELTLNPQTVPFSENSNAVTPETIAAAKAHFSDAEMVELVLGIAGFAFMNRLNRFFEPEIDVEMPPDHIMALLK